MTLPMSKIIEHPFLRSLSPQCQEALVSGAGEASYAAGDIIFREGEPANRFFLIHEGKVRLETHLPGGEDLPVQELGPGDVLGWSWLFPPFVWHFQARAVTPVHLVTLEGARLLVTCNENQTLGYELLKRITQIVIQRLQATRDEMARRCATTPKDAGD